MMLNQGELLAVLADKIDRFDRDLQAMRREGQENRNEFKAEIVDQLKAIRDGKADASRVRLLEVIVYGFVGIILTAVGYALISGHIVPATTVPGVH